MPTGIYPRTKRTCSVSDCPDPHYGRGMCHRHWALWRRNGKPERRPVPTEAERFWSKVNKDGPIPEYAPHLGPCWIWTAGRHSAGYGAFNAEENPHALAHRWAYERLVGEIANGKHLDHLCRVPSCVRPSHLEPVTPRENTLRSPIAPGAINARKTHCIHGHEFTPENTVIRPQGRGNGTMMRCCRICEKAAWTRSNQKRSRRVILGPQVSKLPT